MQNRKLNCIIGAVGIFATALTGLPLIGGKIEYDTILVRGFNLMEFSALGCVSVLAPLLVVLIVFSSQSQVAKEVELILIMVGNLVCYTYALQAARDWLLANESSVLAYHPGIVCVPLSVIVEVLLWYFGGVYIKQKTMCALDEDTAYITFLVPRSLVD